MIRRLGLELVDVVQGQALRSGLVVEEEHLVPLLGSQCLEG